MSVLCPTRHLVVGLTAGLIATFCSQTVASGALDPHPTHPGLVSEAPSADTPNVLNGHVNAFAQVGDTMVVAGSFNEVEAGGTTYHRTNIFAFDVTTGAMDTSFAPDVRGEVYDVLISPDRSKVIAVGRFSSVRGRTGTQRVVALNLDNGSVYTDFDPPRFNKAVRSIGRAHGRYYLTGDFSTADGMPRSGIASLNGKGGLTAHANPRITGVNNGGATKVRTADISPDGTTMVILGNFAKVDGKPRQQVALLNLGRKRTTLNPWATSAFAPKCSPKFNSYMRDVAFAPNSRFFVVVTTGGRQGNQPNGKLCDSASRWNVVGKPGQQPAWIDYTGGDTLSAVIVDRQAVYVGGHQRWMNNSYGLDTAGPGAVERTGIAALDPANGMPYSWNPTRARGVGVAAFLITDTGLWVGSDTAIFNNQPRGRIAFLPAGATPLPPYRTAGLPGRLTDLGRGTSSDVRTRVFDGSTATDPQAVTSSTDWREARGAFVVDGVLYSGWSDGTLHAAAYGDLSSIDRGAEVQLNGAFTDLDRVEAMFFDRVNHRIYYTLTGSKALYYRYFQPESRLVGSWRYRAADRHTDWSKVQSAFVVGKRLYFVNAASGRVQRIGWQPTGVTTGTPVTVLSGGNRAAASVLLPAS